MLRYPRKPPLRFSGFHRSSDLLRAQSETHGSDTLLKKFLKNSWSYAIQTGSEDTSFQDLPSIRLNSIHIRFYIAFTVHVFIVCNSLCHFLFAFVLVSLSGALNPLPFSRGNGVSASFVSFLQFIVKLNNLYCLIPIIYFFFLFFSSRRKR